MKTPSLKLVVLSSGITILLLSILFPPWERMIVYSGSPPTIRCWFLSNPNYYEESMLVLAVGKLTFESGLILLITAGLLVIIHKMQMRRNVGSSRNKK